MGLLHNTDWWDSLEIISASGLAREYTSDIYRYATASENITGELHIKKSSNMKIMKKETRLRGCI